MVTGHVVKTTHYITEHSESMIAIRPICPLITRCELAFTEDSIRNSLSLLGECLISLAAVDQQGRLRFNFVFLYTYTAHLVSSRKKSKKITTYLQVFRDLQE